jgi:hypothetical protein
MEIPLKPIKAQTLETLKAFALSQGFKDTRMRFNDQPLKELSYTLLYKNEKHSFVIENQKAHFMLKDTDFIAFIMFSSDLSYDLWLESNGTLQILEYQFKDINVLLEQLFEHIELFSFENLSTPTTHQ